MRAALPEHSVQMRLEQIAMLCTCTAAFTDLPLSECLSDLLCLLVLKLYEIALCGTAPPVSRADVLKMCVGVDMPDMLIWGVCSGWSSQQSLRHGCCLGCCCARPQRSPRTSCSHRCTRTAPSPFSAASSCAGGWCSARSASPTSCSQTSSGELPTSPGGSAHW